KEGSHETTSCVQDCGRTDRSWDSKHYGRDAREQPGRGRAETDRQKTTALWTKHYRSLHGVGRDSGSPERDCGGSSIQKTVHGDGIWRPLTDFARWLKSEIEVEIVKLF